MTSQFSIPSDWYKTFFTDPVVRFWGAAIPPESTQAEVAFIMRPIGVSPPATIAEIGIGNFQR
jgi:hypothetical protein